MTASPRRQRGPRRAYANDEVEVLWEPRFCIHSGNCTRGLPQVFDAGARPWIDVSAADADRIAAAVLTCPTGALHFRRLDGGQQEEPSAGTTIDARPNGPLFVRGRLRIRDGEGRIVREDTRVALCRCGASRNKPFCDGSHRRTGFRTHPSSAEGADEAGTKPAEPATETGEAPEP